MAEERVPRRLAAVLAADVVGYSRLVEADEAGTVARLKSIQTELLRPMIANDGGRLVKVMGDGVLVEFGSAVDAVRNAVAIQTEMGRRNADVAEVDRIVFRVGINVGDVIVEGDDIQGDGVNVAARLEGLCGPGEVYVSGTVYDQVAGKLPASFEDLGEKTVKNITKPVRVYQVRAQSAEATNFVDSKELPLPDKPSIAVLPFENMSGDPEQEYFSDGISEDIITGLSRLRWLTVIARNSTFTYKGRSIDVLQVSKDLGVRYVLEGSVRKATGRIRVTAQLIDAPARGHIWAERYDRDFQDIFAVQDDITQSIVAAIEPEVGGAERERSLLRRPQNLDAWGSYQRGLLHAYRFGHEDTARALSFFERAVELDPSFAPAHAGVSLAHFSNAILGFGNRDEELRAAFAAAKRSVASDDKDASAHWALGRAYLLMGEHDQSIAELENSIELNPSFAQGYYSLGWSLIVAGRPEDGMPHVDKAHRLSPHDPMLFAFLIVRALALLLMDRAEEGIKWSSDAVRQPNAHVPALAMHAACLNHLGREAEAKGVIDEVLRQRPDYTCTTYRQSVPFRHKSDADRVCDSMRRAGLPE